MTPIAKLMEMAEKSNGLGYRSQEAKMTFDQAVEKIDGIGMVGPVECKTLLRQLQALGLLKFEEESPIMKFHGLKSSMSVMELRELFDKYGYLIVKK